MNVDGTIQSGDPDQQVTIDSTEQELYNPDIPGSTFNESMTDAISAAAYAYQDYEEGDLSDARSFVSFDGLFTNDYREFLLPEAMGDNIDVYYEAPSGQLVLGQTNVQGGLVELYGDMLSTGSGNINVLDGYGAINVVNDTSYPLVTSGLSTGGGTAGLLKITDTGKEGIVATNPLHPELLPLVTEYYRQNGQVYFNSYYTNPNGSVALVVSPMAPYNGPNAGARTASYQPATARFVWEDGQELSVTVTDNYQASTWASVVTLSASNLVSSTTSSGNSAPLEVGEWIDNATDDSSLASVAPGTGVDSFDYEYSYDQIDIGTPTTTVTSSQSSTWYGTTTYYQTTVTTTPKKNINTNSIRADRPINIDFIGYDAGSPQQEVTVSSEGNLLIDGPIQNAGGQTTLSAPDGSIQEKNSGAIVGGQDITLTTATGIGGTTPVMINLTNSGTASNPVLGTLSATSTDGDISIDDQSGSITIGQVTTSQKTGNVTLAADESILAASANNLIEGGAVNLTASFGSVGSLGTSGTADVPAGNALPIVVDVGTASVDNLDVTSESDVFVRQSTGDLRVDKIDSVTGNIRVEVPDGNLVDANNISVPDTQNLSELETQWNSMLATQSTAQISINDTINAYENQIDQEYQTYWMFRNEQPNPSVFDPTFQVMLPPGQLAAWTTYYTNQGTAQGLSGSALSTFVSNALTTLANADTQEYRTDNAIFGKLGNTYNPSYMYLANQTPLSGSVTLTFGPADIDPTGNLIDLPGNGYVTGQAVTYQASSGSSVGGLTSGSTYYAIVDPDDSNEISLAASYEDAIDSTAIQLTNIKGTGNSVSDIFASPNEVFGPANIDNTGLVISLPGNVYTSGQGVVYHANGGSVSGLTDGNTYYVIVNPDDPTQINLATSYANATATNPVSIPLSPVTGTDNVLSTIFQTFGASQVDPKGLSIDLPQNVFTTGQAVIYHANGGSVSGPIDGDTYYVIVDPNNTGSSAFIGLASSYANATASPPVPIQLTNVKGSGNYLSEVDVESQRAAWSQSQLQNSMSLGILEPVLFPSTVQTIPDPNLEGKNVAIVVSGSIGTVSGQDTIALPLSSALPEQEALDLAAAQPADVAFYNAGPNNTLVAVSPTDPSFDPVELIINLQKGISLENTGVVDATAGQNMDLDSGQDVSNGGALLPITLDLVTANGGVSNGHPDGVVRILGLAGIVNAQPPGGVNIIGGDLYMEGGNTGGIGMSVLPIVIDLAPAALLEEANAELSVSISEVNGDLNLVTAFSATGDVDLTADGSILNGNTSNDVNVDAVNASLIAGLNGDHANSIGTSAAPVALELSGSVVAQAYLNINLDKVSGDLLVNEVDSLKGSAFLTSKLGSILDDHTTTMTDPVDDVIAQDIMLTAGPLGSIGTASDSLEIDVAETGTLTSSSGENVYITQPVGDLNIDTVLVSNGGTAFIEAPDGSILNGIPTSQAIENIQAGEVYLFASDNIGAANSPITAAVGNVQAQSTTASIWLVNNGTLTIGGVLASASSSGVQSGGTVNVTAMSPITIAQSISAVGNITLTSTHDASRGDMIATGASIDSTTGSVFLQAGDNFTQDAGNTIQAAVSIIITGDYGNLSGVGSEIALDGMISAPSVMINANGASANLTIAGNLSGQVDDTATINTMTIGGSLSSTGTITAGNINNLVIEQILAGQVKVTGFLNSLSVGTSVTGTYSAGQLGKVVVDGVTVHNAPPPPPPPPPPLVTMTGVQEVMNKKHQVKKLSVIFSGPLSDALAGETSIYRLATPGKKGSYTAKNAGIIKLKSAMYTSAVDTVTLTPKTPFTLAKPVQLVVSGTGASGLRDTYGRLIDGDDNGQAGSNAVAILTKKGVTIDAVELARTGELSATPANGPKIVVAAVRTDRIGGPLELRRSIARKAMPVGSPHHQAGK